MESSIFVFHRDIVQKRNTNINGGIQAILCTIKKNYRPQRCIKICQDISWQQEERQRPQMARQTLGDFHINLQSPPSHIPWSQFQQEIVQEIVQLFGPTQIILLEPLGEINMPKRCVLAIKRSIKELWHLTYFTDIIIVHGVQRAQFCNLWGHWIQATYAISAAIPSESCEDYWVCLTWTEWSQPWMGWYQHRQPK